MVRECRVNMDKATRVVMKVIPEAHRVSKIMDSKTSSMSKVIVSPDKDTEMKIADMKEDMVTNRETATMDRREMTMEQDLIHRECMTRIIDHHVDTVAVTRDHGVKMKTVDQEEMTDTMEVKVMALLNMVVQEIVIASTDEMKIWEEDTPHAMKIHTTMTGIGMKMIVATGAEEGTEKL